MSQEEIQKCLVLRGFVNHDGKVVEPDPKGEKKVYADLPKNFALEMRRCGKVSFEAQEKK